MANKGFPPAKSARRDSVPAKVLNNSPVSTGNGGIPASLKVKAAGTKNAPGVDLDVNGRAL